MNEKIYTQAEVNELLDLMTHTYRRVSNAIADRNEDWSKGDIAGASFNQLANVEDWAKEHGHIPEVLPTPETPQNAPDAKSAAEIDRLKTEVTLQTGRLNNIHRIAMRCLEDALHIGESDLTHSEKRGALKWLFQGGGKEMSRARWDYSFDADPKSDHDLPF